jgi:hypothetical protein
MLLKLLSRNIRAANGMLSVKFLCTWEELFKFELDFVGWICCTFFARNTR